MPDMALHTVEDVARILGVHPETVRNWIKSGVLAAIDLGGRAGYRISQSDLDAFLQKRRGARKDD